MIPATIDIRTSAPIAENRKRKVAAYARVSTEQEEQESSYQAQVDYYTNYIKSRDDWEFVSVYADHGISGLSTSGRDGFNQMIEDALNGKIQLIITKSVSRFARNTVDSLSTIRKLKEHNVECYFEKEGLHTFDSSSEMILSIMATLSQEESRSISENVKWGIRKKFEDGRFSMPYRKFLGYEKGEDGTMVINEDEAKIVRQIYGLFLSNRSTYQIARILTEQGIPTVTGQKVWNRTVIRSVLTNEKYKGCALLQKSYVSNYLTKKNRKNSGEIPQYYVEGSHPAIIEPEVFDRVQAMMERRKSGNDRTTSARLFSSKVKCGCCGHWYGSKVWHSNDKYRRVVYQCNFKFKGEKKCDTPHFYEDELKEMFVKALNKYCENKAEIIQGFTDICDIAFDTSKLEKEQVTLETELKVVSGLIEQLIAENARTVQDQNEYNKSYNALAERFQTAKARLKEVTAEITRIKSDSERMRQFIKTLKSTPDIVKEFDDETWYALIDHVIVNSREDVRFVFCDGGEVRI